MGIQASAQRTACWVPSLPPIPQYTGKGAAPAASGRLHTGSKSK